MGDTWEMETTASPYAWQRLSTGIPQDHAFSSYNDGRVPYAPCGRFGQSTSVHNDSLLLYGGHDGGLSRHGRNNYEPGYDFDELWRFSVPDHSWSLISGGADPGPGKRYLHAMAVVGDFVLIYGGLVESQGDVWAFDLSKGTWELLSKEVSRANGGPGRRVGHSITAIDLPHGPRSGEGQPPERTAGILLAGGRYIEADGSSALDDSLHFFDLEKRTWRKMPTVASAAGLKPVQLPVGRKYHAEASGWVQVTADGSIAPPPKPLKKGAEPPPPLPYVHVTIVAGGTITTPGLTCTAEAWLLTTDCSATEATWERLPDIPTAIYDVRGALSAHGAMFLYGGHHCTDSKGSAPFFYSNVVSKLDLAKAGVKVPKGACRVEAGALPAQRAQGREAKVQDKEL